MSIPAPRFYPPSAAIQAMAGRAAAASPISAPLPADAADSMGVHVHFFGLSDGMSLVNTQDLDLIQAAGFRKVRMDVLWREVEKQPGVYDFWKYDGAIRALLARGIRPMIILGLGNPLYAKGLTLAPPGVRQAYERYALATVNRYKGLGILWEVVNEPNHPDFWQPAPNPDEYMALVRSLLPRLKALDPSGRFIAPSTAGAPADFLDRCFQQGLLNWVDGVSIHPYQIFPNQRPPEFFETEYRRTRALMDRNTPPGRHIPIVLGEWGYPTAPSGPNSLDERTQANYMVRQALLGLMLGSPLNVWYDWKGDINTPTVNPEVAAHNFGLTTQPWPGVVQPRPAWFAMRALTQTLDGMNFERRLPSQPGDYLLAFRPNPRQAGGKPAIIAAWTLNAPHAIVANGRQVVISGAPVFLPGGTPARSSVV